MKKLALLLFFCLSLTILNAQENIKNDSLKISLEPVTDIPQISGSLLLPEYLSMVDLSIFRQPLLPDYNKNLDFSNYLFSKITHNTFAYTGFSSALAWGQVFNQSTLQLNDKILIGGNSFGARSIHDQPRLNPSVNDFSIKGASMFMQYKVSDKFKVQTRISISNRPSSPGTNW